MAAAFISKPGSEYGPCKRFCEHRDCAASRATASTVCRFCDKPIGYETRFYNEDGYVHAACLEDSIETERKAIA